jgi:glycine/D-amino acid oxidase-like deaminating enzyme/nitrite reductase/ring-hydroxylating ferredoxin subunit
MVPHPFWTNFVSKSHYPRLEGTRTVDVAIVGGGITGVTAAYLLKKAGKRVALLEQGEFFEGQTALTTAHLTEVLDTRFYQLIEDFGLESSFLVAEAGRAAIDLIEKIAEQVGGDCAFERVPGVLYSETRSGLTEIFRECEAASELSLECERLSHVDLPFKTAGGIRFSNQAQFNPLRYIQAMLREIAGEDCLIFENSRVVDFRDGDPCEISTGEGRVIAKRVIVSTHTPALNRFFLHTKIAAYRTYALAKKVTTKMGEKNIVHGLFWDNEDPYHYIRGQEIDGESFVLIGGEDHKVGSETNTRKRMRALEDYAQDHFGSGPSSYHWSGQILESLDGLPYIGRNALSSNIAVATGFSGNGMTLGTVSAMVLSDWILEKENRWADIFSATRVNPAVSIGEFVAENKDFPVHLIMDRITPADVARLDEIDVSEGKLIKLEGRKLAIYRDESGTLHPFSAVCPHLGCVVKWNNSESSWDCPCHGSRFDTDGKVLNGPARSGLKPVKISASENPPDTTGEPEPRTPPKPEKAA